MKKLLSVEKKAKYREGVEARKQERARIKKVKELTKAKQDIPLYLLNFEIRFLIRRPSGRRNRQSFKLNKLPETRN